jgi:hypothetical protein
MAEIETKHLREKENIKGQFMNELYKTKKKLRKESEARRNAEHLLEQYKQAVNQLQVL